VIQRLGVAFCVAIAAALSQDNPHQTSPATIRATVREVLVPVVVTDKAGHYVTGLARDDFSVSEDGVLQKIVAFIRSPVSDAMIPPDSRVTNHTKTGIPNIGSSGQPKRTYLICFDSLHSGFEDFKYVGNALKKFFEEEQAGESQYALMALGRELHVVVDSNRDPQTILAAIDSKALLKTILDSEARNIATETDRFANLVGAWCGSCPCTNQYMDMKDMGCPGLKAQVKSEVLSFPERAAILNRNFLQQLSELVHAMASMPTRRTVIFFSDGFNRFAGQEFYDILRAFGANDASLKFNPRDLQPQLDSILKLAMRWDVRFLYSRFARTLYAFGGSG
jgi:VWFA-related protein